MTVSDIVMTLFFAWVVVVTGLVGALVPSSYKWGYYAFGLAALFYIWCVQSLVAIVLVNSLFRTRPTGSDFSLTPYDTPSVGSVYAQAI